jgi:lipopolysaccharide transport system permease protein
MLWGQRSTSAARPLPSASDVWVIAPDVHLGFTGRVREVWRYRRILLFFAINAVRGVYARTKLGIWWLVIRPLAPVFVGAVVFGRFMGVPSEGLPYFLFFLTGSTIWAFLVQPLRRGSQGLEGNRALLTKLYVPRMILPAGQLAGGLLSPLILTAVFAGALCYYRVTTGIWYGVIPARLPVAIAAVLLAITLAFAVSLFTSVWQARARDVRFGIGYVTGFWMLVTPVIYPLSAMPERLRPIAALNPMTGPVEAFRWALLDVGAAPGTTLAVSSAVIALLLAAGVSYFTSAEGAAMDHL